MSTTKRIISGTASSWARISVTMLSQIALVPLFLNYWNVKVYGLWIAIQALVNVLSTLDRGFNDYMQFEFLQLNINEKDSISTKLWSSIGTVIISSLVEWLIIYTICFHSNFGFLFDKELLTSKNLEYEVRCSLQIQWTAWTFTNIVGLFFRSLSPFGYYPRMGWWNVLLATMSSISPAIAVVKGATLIEASYWYCISTIFCLLLQFIDILRLLKKERIRFSKIFSKDGYQNYIISLGLSGRYFLENFRQQGVRLLLAPLSGANGLAAFSTIRTGANVALQGLSTITNPLMPELMRFLHKREQEKLEVAFDSIWLVIVVILSPSVLIVQSIAPKVFNIWTGNKIMYDPFLFATLSLGVLVYGISQPAIAIVAGNNLLKVQIKISIVTSVVVVLGMVILIPKLGILGAGVSLLLAEVLAAFAFHYYAKEWLLTVNMQWPKRSEYIACKSLVIATLGMFFISLIPTYSLLVLILSIILTCWNIKMYWQSMPQEVTKQLNILICKLPVIGKFYNTKIA